MVRVVTCMMLVLCHGSYGEQAATAQMAQSRLAKTTYATISSNAELSIDPPSTVGVVLVATERCSLLMNGEKVTIDAGDHRRILSRTVVKLAKPGTSSSHVLLIQMATQVQPLTFEKFSLAGHRDLEDGSSRNATMIVALGNIRLRALKNLGDESEWQPGRPHLISLNKGQTFWQAPGMYHFKNTRTDPADFLMIEW